MAVSVVLTVVGLVGLSLFGWLVWPPFVLLPFSVACVAAGLFTDWEKLNGKPAAASDKR